MKEEGFSEHNVHVKSQPGHVTIHPGNLTHKHGQDQLQVEKDMLWFHFANYIMDKDFNV